MQYVLESFSTFEAEVLHYRPNISAANGSAKWFVGSVCFDRVSCLTHDSRMRMRVRVAVAVTYRMHEQLSVD
jgi:hypothetical protein